MKDYKKILEGVVNIINTTEKSDIGFVNICSYIGENCPELKESEGERVMKRIILCLEECVHSDIIRDYEKEQCLAWLEKQGEHANFINKIQIGDKVTRNEDGVLVNLSQLKRVAKKDEKQGEQNHIIDIDKMVDEFAHTEVNGYGMPAMIEVDAYRKGVNDALCLSLNLEKQGEQKYMPKYKIGDYVKNTNYKGEPIYEIVYMDKECYICEYRGKERMGDKAVMHFSFDNPYLRLVQNPADKIELKFKAGDKIQYLKGCGTIMTIEKIENDEYIFANNMGHTSIEDGNKWYLVEQNWSEEDEKMVNSIISFCDFKVNIELHNEEVKNASKNILSWLNKLKYRVQSKQEWSEEDEETLKDIITSMTNLKDSATSDALRDIYNSKIDWLESLRPNHWKPSDEQMKVLDMIRRMYNYEELDSLYNDLKKLKDEK